MWIITYFSLDWVAKDNSSYSYPKTIYPGELYILHTAGTEVVRADQESFDSYLPDAGDGLFPNGSVVTPPPDQTTAYVPWNTTAAKLWLSGLTHKPTMVTIDNEMEIASSTHSDMHPEYVLCTSVLPFNISVSGPWATMRNWLVWLIFLLSPKLPCPQSKLLHLQPVHGGTVSIYLYPWHAA